MKTITALQNPTIKHVVSLHSSKNRVLFGQFIAEGLRTIQTMLSAKKNSLKLINLFCTPNTADLAQDLAKNSAVITNDLIIVVSELVMKKMSTNSTPSELLAIFEINMQIKQDITLTPGLVLAHIADPGNMGTLIRTCAAMGYQTVVVIEGVDCYSPKVIQASAGTIAQINLYQLTWQELLAYKKDLNLCALVVLGGKSPNELDLKKSLIIVGNEANGLPEQYLANCSQQLTIPMPGGTESLNAGIAGSIALYLAKQN